MGTLPPVFTLHWPPTDSSALKKCILISAGPAVLFRGMWNAIVPGVDWGTGNLGQGLAAGVGFALAARARGSKARTWVCNGRRGTGQRADCRGA